MSVGGGYILANTISGQPCAFPLSYGGRTMYGCITLDGVLSCPVQVRRFVLYVEEETFRYSTQRCVLPLPAAPPAGASSVRHRHAVIAVLCYKRVINQERS